MKCKIKFSKNDFDTLHQHLFPGDRDEHGAVLLASFIERDGVPILLVKEVHIAVEGRDYVEGKIGYRALTPQFIHRLIVRARDERLVYLAVHNHASDTAVAFSKIDFQSHERGYPALLQIARGMPVGALVLGLRSMQADIWFPDGIRMELEEAVVVGSTIQRYGPNKKSIFQKEGVLDIYDRQVKMFGKAGQEILCQSRVAIVGLGGVGSLLAEYLARLGVGKFYLIDDDHIEVSNYSRVVGSFSQDIAEKTLKVNIAKRNIKNINERADVKTFISDVAKKSVAKELSSCDYIFLAADSMRARLLFNAIVHQYLIPGVQLGSKIRTNNEGTLIDIMGANRPVRPGAGCLWCNQLIDTTQLAIELKSDADRKAQAYGVQEPNPSVITLNAVVAAQAANDFLLDYLDMRPGKEEHQYEHFNFIKGIKTSVLTRRDHECPECSVNGHRYGSGDNVELPCIND